MSPKLDPTESLPLPTVIGGWNVLRQTGSSQKHGKKYETTCRECGEMREQWRKEIKRTVCRCKKIGGRIPSIYLTVDGMTKTVAEWAEHLGDEKKEAGIRNRLHQRTSKGKLLTDRQIVYGTRAAVEGVSAQQMAAIMCSPEVVAAHTDQLMAAIRGLVEEHYHQFMRKVVREVVSNQEISAKLSRDPYERPLPVPTPSASIALAPTPSADPSPKPKLTLEERLAQVAAQAKAHQADAKNYLPEGVDDEFLPTIGFSKAMAYQKYSPDLEKAEQYWQYMQQEEEEAKNPPPPKPKPTHPYVEDLVPVAGAQAPKPTHPYVEAGRLGQWTLWNKLFYEESTHLAAPPNPPEVHKLFPPMTKEEVYAYLSLPWVEWYHGSLSNRARPGATPWRSWDGARKSTGAQPLPSMDDFDIFRKVLAKTYSGIKGMVGEEYWISHCLYNPVWVNHRKIYDHRSFNEHMEIYYMAVSLSRSTWQTLRHDYRWYFEALVDRCLELQVHPHDVACLVPGLVPGQGEVRDDYDRIVIRSPFLPPDDSRRKTHLRAALCEFLDEIIGDRFCRQDYLYPPPSTTGDHLPVFEGAPVFLCNQLISKEPGAAPKFLVAPKSIF